jgi:integrase
MASSVPGAQPEHYVFPHEKYGFATNDRKPCAYETIPTEPTHRWKVAWETARNVANVACRFHDLRHTFISRLAESQCSDSTVMALAGHVSRNGIRVSGMKRNARPWRTSAAQTLTQGGHKIGHSFF